MPLSIVCDYHKVDPKRPWALVVWTPEGEPKLVGWREHPDDWQGREGRAPAIFRGSTWKVLHRSQIDLKWREKANG